MSRQYTLKNIDWKRTSTNSSSKDGDKALSFSYTMLKLFHVHSSSVLALPGDRLICWDVLSVSPRSGSPSPSISNFCLQWRHASHSIQCETLLVASKKPWKEKQENVCSSQPAWEDRRVGTVTCVQVRGQTFWFHHLSSNGGWWDWAKSCQGNGMTQILSVFENLGHYTAFHHHSWTRTVKTIIGRLGSICGRQKVIPIWPQPEEAGGRDSSKRKGLSFEKFHTISLICTTVV